MRANQLGMVRYLLARGADPRMELLEVEMLTIIALAASYNLPEALRLLVSAEEGRGRIKGSWALWHAALVSAFDAAETLLYLSADVNELCNTIPYTEDTEGPFGNGWGTALHCAVHEGQLKFANWLIRKGARLDLRNASSKTASDIAAGNGYPQIREMLETWE